MQSIAYMRAIEMSPWLMAPRLNVIKSKEKTASTQLSDFTLLAQQGVKKANDKAGKGS